VTTCDEIGTHSSTGLKTNTFLIVSEHALLRHWLRESLQQDPENQIAGEAGSVADGVESCLTLSPAVAIVAWSLPDGRGSELVRAVRSRSLRTKFLLLSADPRPHVVRQAFDAGAQGCLFPEATPAMFQEAIQALLNERTYYCPQASRLLIEALRSNKRTAGEALSSSDREILLGVASSEPMKMVADRLGLSSKTVSNRLSNLKSKLGIADVAGLVRYAIQIGLVEGPGA
jgi:DNA-binding NarL/FixJ family response regulator